MKKPDRFERMVAKNCYTEIWGMPCVTAKAALQLLAREHAWLKRLVREELLPEPASASQTVIGWNQALECILEKLERREK